jgi:HAD superfamily hydrolase (TIGR01490 family)
VTIAFFDFDRTLITVNSGSLWVKSELKLGFLSWWEAMRAGLWILRYQFGFVNLEEVVKLIIQSLAGSREDELKARVDAFYERHIKSLYRPGAQEVIDQHRSAGDKLVLITSASSYLAEQVARELAFHDVLCNRFEVDESGQYTGRPLGQICYGAGKLTLAQEYAKDRGIDLSACSFYTDSMADLPLLEVVGKPVAVNPDPRLRRLATERGWTVADWGTSGRPLGKADPPADTSPIQST